MATSEKTLTVLCIDGGGVKGIIPAVMLEYLESQLQAIDGWSARLVDYFDVIAGSGAGGLITALISAPGDHGRPLTEANKIVPLLKDAFHRILKPHPRPNCEEGKGPPVFDKGELPGDLAKTAFGDLKLNQTLTNILIPAYETLRLRPIFFSNELAKTNKPLDATLTDICTGGLSAYPWVRAYEFNSSGNQFHVVDGSVVAPNPALIAITELIRKERSTGGRLDFKRVVMISLGTCGVNPTLPGAGWTSQRINTMSTIELLNTSTTMLGEFTAVVNAYAVDYQVETIFEAYGSSQNYLRIYEDDLSVDMKDMDNASNENLKNLVTYAKKLLDKTVTRTGGNPAEARVVAGSSETYAQALTRFAKALSQEKKARSAA